MKNVLSIEDIVDGFSMNFKMMYPLSKGTFVAKRNVTKGVFGAIKTFSVELFFVEEGFPTESIIICNFPTKTTSEQEEDFAWRELGIMFIAKLFSYNNCINLDKYGCRN